MFRGGSRILIQNPNYLDIINRALLNHQPGAVNQLIGNHHLRNKRDYVFFALFNQTYGFGDSLFQILAQIKQAAMEIPTLEPFLAKADLDLPCDFFVVSVNDNAYQTFINKYLMKLKVIASFIFHGNLQHCVNHLMREHVNEGVVLTPINHQVLLKHADLIDWHRVRNLKLPYIYQDTFKINGNTSSTTLLIYDERGGSQRLLARNELINGQENLRYRVENFLDYVRRMNSQHAKSLQNSNINVKVNALNMSVIRPLQGGGSQQKPILRKSLFLSDKNSQLGGTGSQNQSGIEKIPRVAILCQNYPTQPQPQKSTVIAQQPQQQPQQLQQQLGTERISKPGQNINAMNISNGFNQTKPIKRFRYTGGQRVNTTNPLTTNQTPSKPLVKQATQNLSTATSLKRMISGTAEKIRAARGRPEARLLNAGGRPKGKRIGSPTSRALYQGRLNMRSKKQLQSNRLLQGSFYNNKLQSKVGQRAINSNKMIMNARRRRTTGGTLVNAKRQ